MHKEKPHRKTLPSGTRTAAERPAPGTGQDPLEALQEALSDPDQLALLAELRWQLQQMRLSRDAARKRYRTLLDAVPDAVTVFDQDDHVVDANRAACQRFGQSHRDMTRLNLQDINPDAPQGHIRDLLARNPPGEPFIDRTNNLDADGTPLPSEVHSNCYVDNGQPRVLAIARDLSDTHHALQQLTASRQRYRDLLQAMDKGVVIQDSKGRILSANPAACQLLGMDEEQIKSSSRKQLPQWRFVDADNQPLELEQLPGSRALATGKSIRSMLVGAWLPHLQTCRWLSVSAVPQHDDSGEQIQQVVNTFSDVSHLKRKAEMFRNIQQLGNIGCWEINDQTATVTWTEQMYRIAGLDPDSDINEQRMLHLFPSADRARLAKALEQARENGKSFDLETRLLRRDGTRWVTLHGAPMYSNGQINGLVGAMQDISQRKKLEQQLQRRATHDPLTGLPNRDSMLASMQAHLDASDHKQPAALLYIDLDRFKLFSDMLGHKAGDRLLQAAAKRLADCTGSHGALGHFGNDEFLLFVTDPGQAGSTKDIAKHILTAFKRTFRHGDEELALGLSIGIAQWPEDARDAEQLLQHADQAMFEAKRRGRNTWQAWNALSSGQEMDRAHIESRLRLATDHDQMHLLYQPQIDSRNGRMVGVESLLRWQHPQLGMVPPDRFIPFAEESGEIVRIGSWVIDQACQQLSAWQKQGLQTGRMAVNVSHRQILSGTLMTSLQQAIERHGTRPENLVLEFTERVVIDRLPETLAVFRELRAMGVRLLIDDFGEGFSSLNYLRELPVDGIKISHSFMQGIPDLVTDTVLCEAMARIADALGLKVIAEGVETERQRDFISSLGIHLVQGYLYSPPLDAADIPDFAAVFPKREMSLKQSD